MRLFSICICIMLILTGCLPRAMQPPPTGWYAYRVPKNISPKIIQQDMITCGFDSPDTSYIASNDKQNTQYINAVLCMEKKGYSNRSLPKGVCYRYSDKPACQNHLKQQTNENNINGNKANAVNTTRTAPKNSRN